MMKRTDPLTKDIPVLTRVVRSGGRETSRTYRDRVMALQNLQQP